MTKKLFENWNESKKELIDSITSSNNDIVKYMLEEQARIFAEKIDAEAAEELRLAGMTTEEIEAEKIIEKLKAPPKPKGIRIPMINRIMPNIIADELLGVQPMTGPFDDIHTLKVKWGINKEDL